MSEHEDTTTVLEVDRGDVATTRLVEAPAPAPGAGEVALRVDRFALTANNVTYAVAGEVLGYWDFFPAEAPWGRVPAMGWADVVASGHDDVPVGGRCYGWFPMAGRVTTTVSPVEGGLRDDAPHRTAHAPVYRRFAWTEDDPWYDAAGGEEAEDRHALLRGLFLTGFLADASLADRTDDDGRAYLGADEVLVVSASSKTAIGFARNAAAHEGLRVVGLTSPGNADFVADLGVYDEVVTYDEVGTGAAPGPAAARGDARAVVVDMAGNPAVVGALHRAADERILASVFVGKSHHDADEVPVEGGPEVEFFFAPTEVSHRIRAWGQDGYDERTTRALHDFVADSRRWLDVERRDGPEAVRDAWADLVAGRVPPSVGIVASLHA